LQIRQANSMFSCAHKGRKEPEFQKIFIIYWNLALNQVPLTMKDRHFSRAKSIQTRYKSVLPSLGVSCMIHPIVWFPRQTVVRPNEKPLHCSSSPDPFIILNTCAIFSYFGQVYRGCQRSYATEWRASFQGTLTAPQLPHVFEPPVIFAPHFGQPL